MLRNLVGIIACFVFTFAAPLAHAQDGGDPAAMSSGSSSATTSGTSGAPSTNAESTGQVVMSPFQGTANGLVTSSEWTSAQLAASATGTGMVLLVALVIVALLVAVGVGIFLTVRAKAGNETAFRRFLRMNRHALQQQVVAGHGPVLVDMGELFGVRDAYPVFAGVMRRNERVVRPFLSDDGMEGDGASRLSQYVVNTLLFEGDVLAEWIRDGKLTFSLGPI